MKKKKLLAPIILLISILLMFCSGCGDSRFSARMEVYAFTRGTNVVQVSCQFDADHTERTRRFTYDGKEHVFSRITLRDSSNRDIESGYNVMGVSPDQDIVLLRGAYDDGSGTWQTVYNFKEVGTYVFYFEIQKEHTWAIPFTAKLTLIVEPDEDSGGDSRYSTEMRVYTETQSMMCQFDADNTERTEHVIYDGEEHVFSSVTLKYTSGKYIESGYSVMGVRPDVNIVVITGKYDDGSGTWQTVGYSYKEVGTYVFHFEIQKEHTWAIPFTAELTLIVEPNEE